MKCARNSVPPMKQNKKHKETARFDGTGLHCLFGAFCEFLHAKTGEPIAQKSEGNAQDQCYQHIGGVVNVQVQPGQGDQTCQNQSRDAQLLVVQHQDGRSFKRGDGMSGGEGVVVQTIH